MPLVEYKCRRCGLKSEELFRVNHVPGQITCGCGGMAVRCMSLIAATPGRWGDSHGYFDMGLGKYVENSMDRDKKMRQAGLVHCGDFDKHYMDDRLEKEERDIHQHEADVAEMTRLESTGLSRGEALANVYNQERILGGE